MSVPLVPVRCLSAAIPTACGPPLVSKNSPALRHRDVFFRRGHFRGRSHQRKSCSPAVKPGDNVIPSPAVSHSSAARASSPTRG